MEHSRLKDFIIKSPETQDELAGLYALNKAVHGGQVEDFAKKIVEAHPSLSKDNFLIAKEPERGGVVSTISLFPWHIVYEGTELTCLEMGIVATDERYRNMGLLSALFNEFNRRFIEGKYELSIIAGIPGFYKRYGYQYAIPLENQYFLELRDIEDYRGDAYSIAKADIGNCDAIASFYREHVASYTMASEHRAQEYAFMMDRRYDSELEADLFMVKFWGKPAGYFKISLHGFTEGLILSEASSMDYEGYLAVLGFLKALAIERGKPFIKLSLPEFHDLIRIALALGGYKHWGYEWQVRMNLKRFLETIAPVLERRLEQSMLKGLSYGFHIHLYGAGLFIEFKEGRLAGVKEGLLTQEECALSIQSFQKLILGCESLDELEKKDREIFLKAKNRLVLGALFPKGRPYLYIPY